MKLSTAISTLALVAVTFSRASGGTIITTNLPAGDAIINISGTADGAAAFGGATPPGAIGAGQDYWYQPFNTTGNLLEYTVAPGTYQFRVINQADAGALFPSLTAGQLGGIGAGAWTYNIPWGTDYVVFDSSAATNPNEHQLFSGAITPGTAVPGSTGFNGGGYNTAAEAYTAAQLGGYYDTIVTNGGRYTGTTVSSYTFTSAETLIFVIPDYYLPDNSGILSVLITSSSVPEPSSLTLAALAGAWGVGYWLRKRRIGRAGRRDRVKF